MGIHHRTTPAPKMSQSVSQPSNMSQEVMSLVDTIKNKDPTVLDSVMDLLKNLTSSKQQSMMGSTSQRQIHLNNLQETDAHNNISLQETPIKNNRFDSIKSAACELNKLKNINMLSESRNQANLNMTQSNTLEYEKLHNLDASTGNLFGTFQKSSTPSNIKQSKVTTKKIRTSVKNIKNSLFSLHLKETKKTQNEEMKMKSPQQVKESREYQTQNQLGSGLKAKIKHDQMDSSIIPFELPHNSKKFIEAKTKEVLYLTPDGLTYTEDANGRLIKLDSLASIAPKVPNAVKSANVQNNMHTKNKSSLTESISTPMMNLNEKSIMKPENMNMGEGYLNHFTNQMNVQMPYGMASPSGAFQMTPFESMRQLDRYSMQQNQRLNFLQREKSPDDPTASFFPF